jgi:hypothetical protein
MKIYFDTEFVSLWRPECMSVGMAAEDGSTLYVEIHFDPARLSQFSRDVVAPLLEGKPVDRPTAADRIRAYLNRFDAPELVCDFIGDWWLLLDLVDDLEDYAIPRCAMNGAPDMVYADIRQRHHALADAIALRDFKPAIQQGTD